MYVARGSHAGYFEFKTGGHEAKFDIDKVVPGGLGPLLKVGGWAAKQAREIPVVKQRLDEYEDHVPARPGLDDGVDATRQDVKLRPDLNLLPVREPGKDAERWWWLWMRSRWGSSHSRAAMAEIRARRATEHKALRAAVTLVDEETAIVPRLDALRALLRLNTVTTVSVVLGTTSTAVAFVRTLSG